MKLSVKHVRYILLFVLIGTFNSYSQNYKDSLDLKLKAFHKENALPGFAAAIVTMNGIIYQNTLGFADIAAKKPYTSKTIQNIASTTKTTIAYAVMKLKEERKLSLESPINDFLPFKVVNPFYKDSIIRIKHLVTHTSGILDTDNNYDLRTYFFTKNTNLKDSKLDTEDLAWFDFIKSNDALSLEDYFQNVFSKKGIWYNDNTFHNKSFGKHYKYSNLGAGLMAYIIERITGVSFDSYIEKNVFKNLNMKETKFNENDVDKALLAKSYITDKMISSPSLGQINYPDGGMHTNLEELCIYLIEMIKGYNGQSNLLSLASFKQMMSPVLSEVAAASNPQKTFNNIGVFWQLDDDGSIKHYGGNTFGGSVYFSFNPKTNIGRILMTNCFASVTRESQIEFISIWRTLGKYESKL
jgi:CubicO group peptidase (beta-lactamase class C family)